MKKFPCLALAALLMFAASPLMAQRAASYIPAASLSPLLLTPPLAPHSDAWNAEIDSILVLQDSASDEEIAAAQSERSVRPELVSLAVDDTLSREAYPRVYALLDRVAATSRAVTDRAKDYWDMKRPYLSDGRVKALIEPHDNPSYPSGHTSGSYLQAHVLGQLLPEKRQAFIARAAEIAHHRVLVGMHYPHDVEGGKELALMMMGALSQNADFQRDFKVAQQELAAKRP